MKKLVLFTLILLCLATAVACSAKDGAVSAEFQLIGPEGDAILTSTLDCSGSVGDLIKTACQQEKMAFTASDGMYDNFAGIASGTEEGWILYINGEVAEEGADAIKLSEGLKAEFRYISYSEAFPEFY